MNGAIDATTTEQRTICRINDSINPETGDVTLNKFENGQRNLPCPVVCFSGTLL